MNEVESQDETVEIPASILGGQKIKPGDVVRLEVVGEPDESGMVKVKYAVPESPDDVMGGMAAQMNQAGMSPEEGV